MLCINTVQQRDETQQVGTDSVNILAPNNCHNLPSNLCQNTILLYDTIPKSCNKRIFCFRRTGPGMASVHKIRSKDGCQVWNFLEKMFSLCPRGLIII